MNIKIIDVGNNEIPVIRIEEYGNDVTVMISSPVWHDAKETPPNHSLPRKLWGKVDYDFAIIYEVVFWTKFGWENDRGKKVNVMKYTTLPQPPEEK